MVGRRSLGVSILLGSILVASACSTHHEFGQGGSEGGGEAGGAAAGRGAGTTPGLTGGTGYGGAMSAAGSNAGVGAEAPGGSSGAGGDATLAPCEVDPCLNGGVCRAEGDQEMCDCPATYEGVLCEQEVDDCAASPCQNGGECVDASGSYSCSCKDGFSGVDCERVVSGCDDQPCLNASTCVGQGSAYTCQCKPGYAGNNCQQDVNECATNPCKNGALCTDGINKYTCACKAGYSGTECQTDINECATNPCKNGASCINGVNKYTCTCAAGYSGTECQTDIDECATSPCKNGASCINGVNKYTCSCSNLYTSPTCQYLEVKLVPTTFLGGGWATIATDISNDGLVLLMNATKGSSSAIGRLVDFGAANSVTLGAPYVDASGYGINNDGGVIVGSGLFDSVDNAIKIVGSTTSTLDLSPLGWGDAYTVSKAVSADGTAVVGTISAGGGTTAFYCKSGQACREVPTASSGILKTATSVSGDGSVVVGYTVGSDGSVSAWRWLTSTAQGATLSLPSTSWTLSSARGVSRNGLVVVGGAAINGVDHAVRWSGTPLTATDLGTGLANDTSADGSVTVGTDAGVPTVWFGTTRQTLASVIGTNPDLSGATLNDAVAVSDDGKVVAATATVSGVKRALMIRLP